MEQVLIAFNMLLVGHTGPSLLVIVSNLCLRIFDLERCGCILCLSWHGKAEQNNDDLRSSQHLVMQPIQKSSFPSNFHLKTQLPLGSCSPSGSSNDMWPWWYKPSSGKVRSKSSNNEASRRNLRSSVCCREGCGNNAQRSIHSVLRGTSCKPSFYTQLWHLWNQKSSCQIKTCTFSYVFKVDDDFEMLENMWWPAWVLSSMLRCSFDEEYL